MSKRSDEDDFEEDTDHNSMHSTSSPPSHVTKTPPPSALAKPSPNSDEAVIRQALEAGVWKEAKDQKTGKTYYYNRLTNRTTWDLKKELGLTGQPQAAAKEKKKKKKEEETDEMELSASAVPKLQLPLRATEGVKDEPLSSRSLESDWCPPDPVKGNFAAFSAFTAFGGDAEERENTGEGEVAAMGDGEGRKQRGDTLTPVMRAPLSPMKLEPTTPVGIEQAKAPAAAAAAKDDNAASSGFNSENEEEAQSGKRAFAESSGSDLVRGPSLNKRPQIIFPQLIQSPQKPSPVFPVAETGGKRHDSSVLSVSSASAEAVTGMPVAAVAGGKDKIPTPVVTTPSSEAPPAIITPTITSPSTSMPIKHPAPAPQQQEQPAVGGAQQKAPMMQLTGKIFGSLGPPRTAATDTFAAATTLPSAAAPLSRWGALSSASSAAPAVATAVPAASPTAQVASVHNDSQILESLIRAYATLRNHAVPHEQQQQQLPSTFHPSTRCAYQQRHVDVVEYASGKEAAAVHYTTDPAMLLDNGEGVWTDRVRQHRRTGGGTPGVVVETYLHRMEANEDALEAEILNMVLEMSLQDRPMKNKKQMMQEEAQQHHKEKKAPMSFEHLTVEDHRRFITEQQASTTLLSSAHGAGSGRGDPFNPATDHTGVEAIIKENLAKYVLRPVKRRAVSAPFARCCLIDLLSSIADISMSHFGTVNSAGDAAQNGNVFLVYQGPIGRPCDTPLVAFCSQLLHSIPFESTESEQQQQQQNQIRRPMFRLEYWVTKKSLDVIASCVRWCLRSIEAVVTDAYAPFTRSLNKQNRVMATEKENDSGGGRKDDAEMEDLFICELPMFSVVRSPTDAGDRTALPAENEASAQQQQQQANSNRQEGLNESVARAAQRFALQEEHAEAICYCAANLALSTTEHIRLLSDQKKSSAADGSGGSGSPFVGSLGSLIATPGGQQAVADCVCDTLEELLSDEAIRSAIVRKSTERVRRVLMMQGEEEKKKQRDQLDRSGGDEVEEARSAQRMQIAEAERKAELMVKKLKFEMGIA